MDDTRKQQPLVELLERRYRQADRVALLEHLGVDPETCTLGTQQPEEVAWRMVRWFADRGRLEELERAARASWLRRRARRLSLASGLTALLVLGLGIGANWFNLQKPLCQLSVAQPALGDACGALGLGEQPTRAERLAWAARERNSCAALQAHLGRFPQGAYRHLAAAWLAAARSLREEHWTQVEHPLELYAGKPQTPAPTRQAAETAARARAQAEAERLCKTFASTGQNRLESTRIEGMEHQCDRVSGGFVCSAAGQARCAVAVRSGVERKQCVEDPPP